MSISSREILKILRQAGFEVDRQTGSHVQLWHAEKRRQVTVPHPKKDIAIGTLKSIERQSGIQLRKK